MCIGITHVYSVMPCMLFYISFYINACVVKQYDHTHLCTIYVVFRQDTSGRTAVHAACMGGSPQCLKLLLDYGGNTRIRSLLGELPEDVVDRLKEGSSTLLALLQGSKLHARTQCIK